MERNTLDAHPAEMKPAPSEGLKFLTRSKKISSGTRVVFYGFLPFRLADAVSAYAFVTQIVMIIPQVSAPLASSRNVIFLATDGPFLLRCHIWYQSKKSRPTIDITLVTRPLSPRPTLLSRNKPIAMAEAPKMLPCAQGHFGRG